VFFHGQELAGKRAAAAAAPMGNDKIGGDNSDATTNKP